MIKVSCSLTSSRCTRKVTLLPMLAVSLPSLVVSKSPLGGLLGHCCFLAVYISFTPLVQLFSTTLRYLWKDTSWTTESFSMSFCVQSIHSFSSCSNSLDATCDFGLQTVWLNFNGVALQHLNSFAVQKQTRWQLTRQAVSEAETPCKVVLNTTLLLWLSFARSFPGETSKTNSEDASCWNKKGTM